VKIGPITKPANIPFTPELPKTRSGKIMRRLLRDVAENRPLGDTTTLAEPAVVAELQDRAASEAADDVRQAKRRVTPVVDRRVLELHHEGPLSAGLRVSWTPRAGFRAGIRALDRRVLYRFELPPRSCPRWSCPRCIAAPALLPACDIGRDGTRAAPVFTELDSVLPGAQVRQRGA
jgi:hypothetical protein